MSDSYSYGTGGVSVSSSQTGKGIVGISTPSTVRARVARWRFETDAGASGDAPVLGRLMRTSAAGNATSRTAQKSDDPAAPTALVTPKDTYTVDPTLGDEIDHVYLPTTGGGVYDYTFPDGRQPLIPVSQDVVIVADTGGQARVLRGRIWWAE